MVTLQRLVDAGFMINTKKTKFLVREAKILGHEVRPGYVKPNFKKLQALFDIKPPTSFK